MSARRRHPGVALLVAAALLTVATVVPTQLAQGGGASSAQARTATLSVMVGGDGRVTSNDGNIACPGSCSNDYAVGTRVVLTATSEGFQGWSGDCSGTDLQCTLVMDANRSVGAEFIGAAPTPTPSPTPSPTPTPTPSPSATPSPAPTATPTPAPSLPLRVTARIPSPQSLGDQRGALVLRVRCPRPCVLLVSGTIAVPGGSSAVFRIRRSRRTLRPGRTTRVRVPLSTRARRAVAARAAERRPATARLRLELTAPQSSRTTLRRRVSVVP